MVKSTDACLQGKREIEGQNFTSPPCKHQSVYMFCLLCSQHSVPRQSFANDSPSAFCRSRVRWLTKLLTWLLTAKQTLTTCVHVLWQCAVVPGKSSERLLSMWTVCSYNIEQNRFLNKPRDLQISRTHPPTHTHTLCFLSCCHVVCCRTPVHILCTYTPGHSMETDVGPLIKENCPVDSIHYTALPLTA